jgi:hypothetical protein
LSFNRDASEVLPAGAALQVDTRSTTGPGFFRPSDKASAIGAKAMQAKISRHLRNRRLPREVEVEARAAAALIKEADGRAIPKNA